MKKLHILIFTGLILTFTACDSGKKGNNDKQANKETKTYGITLKNPGNKKRFDENIVLTRKELSDITKEIPSDKKPLVKDKAGQAIPCQTDDLDGDGKWDEFAFQVSLDAGTTKNLKISYVKEGQFPDFPEKAHAVLNVSKNRDSTFTPVKEEVRPDSWKAQKKPMRYLLEGPGWENNLVGFRHYFDERNGKDIFGKKTGKMVLDSIGYPDDNYHKMDNWGMDILKVGNSLGAGAWALVKNEKLHRLTGANKVKYQLISDGPVRAIFSQTYKGWKVNGQKINAKERITIWANKYHYKNEIKLSGVDSPQSIAVGIVNMKSDSAHELALNDKFKGLATHAKQSENKDFLGMGLLVKQKNFEAYGKAPEKASEKENGIVKSNYIKIKVPSDKYVPYCFFAGWEKTDSKFKKKGPFIDLLKSEANNLANPVKISSDNKEKDKEEKTEA